METKSFKMNRLFVLAVALMTLSVNVWGDDSYVITFKDNGTSTDGSSAVSSISDIVESGNSYVSSVSATKIYQARDGYGIKGGTSSAKGSITLNWNVTNYAVKPTSIVVRMCLYDSNKTMYVYINGGTANEFTPTTSMADYEVKMDGNTNLSSIKVEAKVASSNRFYVESITVNYGSSCTGTQLTTPSVTATPGNASATLTWAAVSNASSYQVSWNGGAYATATSPYEKSGLTNGTEYTWKVKAIGNGTTYCDSEEASGTVTPALPSNHTVTWKANGTTFTTTAVAHGANATAPAYSALPCGDKFCGWTAIENYQNESAAPSDLFTTTSPSTITTDGVVFYAVFADEVK